jgi:regulator of protease activity HflC (stomatin/prohibitin superfamily)
MKIRRLAAVAALPLVLALAACSQATTDSTQQAIRYAGGSLDAETFKSCQSGPAIHYGDPGDKLYYYPAAQRTYSFDDAPGAKVESGPIAVTTKDAQEVTVRGYVTFQLTSDCDKLRKFHELIGKRMGADFEQGAQEDTGWSAFLAQYFGLPINAIMDNVGVGYTWRELYQNSNATDKNIQATFQDRVKNDLGAAINANIGEGVIVVNGVDIQRPEPAQALRDSLQQTEKANADAQARIAQANADKSVADKQEEVAAARAKSDKICRENYTGEQCTVQKLAEEDQLKNYRPGGNLQVEQK